MKECHLNKRRNKAAVTMRIYIKKKVHNVVFVKLIPYLS